MANFSNGFVKQSNGVLIGAIGPLDRWLVCVVQHESCDGVTNPVSFFSMEGCYALNIQCIC